MSLRLARAQQFGILLATIAASASCAGGGAGTTSSPTTSGDSMYESSRPTSQDSADAVPGVPLDQTAEAYVRLVLAMGAHDADYVDAYYGPAAWREEEAARARTLEEIDRDAATTLNQLATWATRPGAVVAHDEMDEMVALRHAYQRRQLEALVARVAILRGTRMTFEEESRALYDAVAPRPTVDELEAALAEVDALLPGEGALVDRFTRYRDRFAIPADRVDAVFQRAIEECRLRSAPWLDLPAEEAFRLEYVTGKTWSGYNWYQGGYQSLIQINTDLPIGIDRAVDLACHEGYPGHHAYNALLEEHLVRERGWVEFSVYPLFSPQSLIAEGTANFGIDIAFPGTQRLDFERDVLYPLAGLDPNEAAGFARLLALLDRLSYAGNEAARRYLDGEIDAAAAADWLERYTLSSRPRAEQRVRFFDQYRSYVINYNLGKDLVRAHVEALGGTANRPDVRWREFVKLLASPRLPSGLERTR